MVSARAVRCGVALPAALAAGLVLLGLVVPAAQAAGRRTVLRSVLQEAAASAASSPAPSGGGSSSAQAQAPGGASSGQIFEQGAPEAQADDGALWLALSGLGPNQMPTLALGGAGAPVLGPSVPSQPGPSEGTPGTVTDQVGLLPTPSPSPSAEAQATGSPLPLPQDDLVLDVKRFGAAGDGVADDWSAIKGALAELHRRGQGTVHFPPGRYLVGERSLGALGFELEGLSGVTISGDQATLVAPRSFAARQSDAFFRIKSCQGLTVDGLAFEFQPHVWGQEAKGYFAFDFLPSDSPTADVQLTRLRQTGGAGFLRVQGNANLTDGQRVRRISVSEVAVVSAGYGLNCQFNGDDLNVKAFEFTRGHRAYFPYGVARHRVQITSKGNDADDAYLVAYEGKGCQDIELDYTNVGSTSAFPAQSAAPAVSVAFGDERPATFKGLRLRLHVRYHSGGGLGNAFQLAKYNRTGAYDVGGRGHLIEGLTLGGLVEGPTASVPVASQGAWDERESIRDFAVDQFKVTNGRSVNFMFLRAAKSSPLISQLETNGNAFFASAEGVPLLFRWCAANTFTGSTGDTSPAVYENCQIRLPAMQSRLNKTFVSTPMP